MEISVVNIPSNPHALATGRQATNNIQNLYNSLDRKGRALLLENIARLSEAGFRPL